MRRRRSKATKLAGTSVVVKRSICLRPRRCWSSVKGMARAVAPADDFAVEDEVGGDFAKGWKEFWEFGDAVEGAGVDLYLLAAFVDLGADAVEFFFYERACGECGDQVGGAVYGTG